MLSKSDKKFLKDNFPSKESLKEDLHDMRSQILDAVDGRLKARLEKQGETIIKHVCDYIADTIVPMFDSRDRQIKRIEKQLDLPPLAD